MIVYHGTDFYSAQMIKNGIILNKGKKNVDFGPGFYVTPNLNMAKKWAVRKSIFRKQNPVVVIFEFDERTADKIVLKLQNDLLWGRFIINNRNGYDYIKNMTCTINNLDAKYPIVYGRIADIDTIDIANELKKSMKELETVERMINPYYSYQYSFHTKESLSFLTIKNMYFDVNRGEERVW